MNMRTVSMSFMGWMLLALLLIGCAVLPTPAAPVAHVSPPPPVVGGSGAGLVPQGAVTPTWPPSAHGPQYAPSPRATAFPTQPPPTRPPQAGAPTQPPQAAPTSAPITIDGVQASPADALYYGPCQNNEPSTLQVEATIKPSARVREARLWYSVMDANGNATTAYAVLTSRGNDRYGVQINFYDALSVALQTFDGKLEYWVEVVDQNGNSITGATYMLDARYCLSAAVGPPLQPPAGGNNPPGGGMTFANFALDDDPLYYGSGCTTQATTTTLWLDIAPATDVQSAELNYAFTGPDGASPVFSTPMQHFQWDTFTATVDTAGIEQYLGQGGGTVEFWVYATDTTGADATSNYYSAQVQFCGNAGGGNGGNAGGGNGGNAGGGNGGNAGGGSVVRFYNNSSHIVVELLIDGQDVILTEAQSFVPGGYLDVTVSPGSHTYAAGVGFWSGGQKVSIYPLPTGTFSDQSGSVTLVDPSIEQVMTNYGQGGYYAGIFWDDNAIAHCAAFDFHSDGTMDFYVDGALNDNGTYSLVARDPATYAVTVRLVNAAGTEHYDGTYYYSGAAAGMLYVANGPASWTNIEYALNGSCP